MATGDCVRRLSTFARESNTLSHSPWGTRIEGRNLRRRMIDE
ncbi:hypothetical protein ACFQL7_19520 [Halocatena marina]|uniref:Uncharacterized protein n=1 Tax=Halocatena marina TaxID=2934937 RepID=A0ABD5YRG1_9EURY